jgi:hypothetical protein
MLSSGQFILLDCNLINWKNDIDDGDLDKLYVKLKLNMQDSKAIAHRNRIVLSLPEFEVFINEWKTIEHSLLWCSYGWITVYKVWLYSWVH